MYSLSLSRVATSKFLHRYHIAVHFHSRRVSLVETGYLFLLKVEEANAFFSDYQINRVEEQQKVRDNIWKEGGRGGDEGYVEEAWTHSVEHAFPTGWLRQHFNLTPKHSTTRCDASTTTTIPPTLPGARPLRIRQRKQKIWKGERKKNPCFIYRSFLVPKKNFQLLFPIV